MTRRRTLVGCVVVLWAAVVVVAYLRVTRLPESIGRGDALYDAVVAQQLVRGEGFTTRLMPLGGLGVLLPDHLDVDEPWPSAHKFVLSQLRVAAFLAFTGDPMTAARLSSIVPFALLAALMFLVLERRLRSAVLAMAWTGVFVALDPLSRLSVSGLNLTGDALLFLALVLASVSSTFSRRRTAAVGVGLALLVLHRYSMVLIGPFVLLAVWRAAGWRRAAAVAGVAAAILVPFVVWSFVRTGLFFSSYLGGSLFLHHTPYLPSDPWYVRAWPTLGSVLAGDPAALADKWTTDVAAAWRDAFGARWALVRGVVLVGLAATGVRALVRESPAARAVLPVYLAFALGFIAFHLLMSRATWYFTFLTPPVWIAAAIGAGELTGRLARTGLAPAVQRLARGATHVGLALFLTSAELSDSCALYRWHRAHPHDELPDSLPTRREVLAVLAAHDGPRRILMGGNRPWELAPSLAMRTIPMVESVGALAELRRAGVAIDLLYIPADLTFAGDGVRPAGWVAWYQLAVARPAAFDEYRLLHELSDGAVAYERTPGIAAAPFCPAAVDVDLRRPHATMHLDAAFRFVEGNGRELWSWLQGRAGDVTVFVCARGAGRRLTVRMIALGTVRVLLDGAEVAVIAPSDGAWIERAIDVDGAGPADGMSTIRFEVDRTNEHGLSLAFGGARLESR